MSDNNLEIGQSFGKDEDGWRTMILSDEEMDWFFKRFYIGKKLIGEDEQYKNYLFVDTGYDKEEDEHVWLKRTLIQVSKDSNVVRMKDITSKPTYKVRSSELTQQQELTLRTWIGTVKNPKGNKVNGRYLGVDKDGYALFISPHSGNTLKIAKDGEVITEKVTNFQEFSLLERKMMPIFEENLDQALLSLKKFQTDLNITTNIQKLLDSIEAIELKLQTIFPTLKGNENLDDVDTDKSFLAELDKRKLKVSEIFNTDDSATLIKAPIKYAWISTIDASDLDMPVYLLLQYYIKETSEWSSIKLYNVQKDIENFYEEISSVTLEIRQKNKPANKWIYITSNAGENWILQNTENQTGTFKKNITMDDLQQISKHTDIEIIFY